MFAPALRISDQGSQGKNGEGRSFACAAMTRYVKFQLLPPKPMESLKITLFPLTSPQATISVITERAP